MLPYIRGESVRAGKAPMVGLIASPHRAGLLCPGLNSLPH